MFFAHSVPERGKESWQPLRDHLIAVGALARSRGSKFGAANAAWLAGLLHDLGKYSPAFQRRLDGVEGKVDHSTAGAQEIVRLATTRDDQIIAKILAHAIAGHHSGLPDTIGDGGSLNERLKRDVGEFDSTWQNEIAPDGGGLMPVGVDWRDRDALAYRLAFFGRMVFSCLVDADFRDTERFYCAAEKRTVDRDWQHLPQIVDELIARFDRHMSEKCACARDSAINRLRSEILAHVRARAAEGPGLFTLTVPTGGGKTLASLAFALAHAKMYGLERIVYAIPFTSVIDQTAEIFQDVLGPGVVLEHHSSIDEERFQAREARDKLRLAMEDWAAPVVVTTNVQLFESLYANRPSRCRRLHNLAKSVIVLDEAQTIPLHVLRPCLAAIDELARNYGASVVLCTATQPAVGAPSFPRGLPLDSRRELAPDPARLHQSLRRVRLMHLGEKSDDDLVKALREAHQGLVIVNSRKHALELHRKAKDAGLDGVIHLSTRQYAAHRRRILGDVRVRLEEGAPCRLIATSLIEAGVDVDFPRVWRAEAGLDQIAQAAGRCNREGSRAIEDSVVGVFRASSHRSPREIEQLSGDLGRIVHKHADLLSPDALRDYFGEVYWRKGEALDRERVMKSFLVSPTDLSFDYRKVAEGDPAGGRKPFRLVESGLVPVIIPREEAAVTALSALRGGLPPATAARKLQAYIVQVPPRARASLLANGHVRLEDGFGDQFAVLVTESLYRDSVGLVWEDADYLQVEDAII